MTKILSVLTIVFAIGVLTASAIIISNTGRHDENAAASTASTDKPAEEKYANLSPEVRGRISSMEIKIETLEKKLRTLENRHAELAENLNNSKGSNGELATGPSGNAEAGEDKMNPDELALEEPGKAKKMMEETAKEVLKSEKFRREIARMIKKDMEAKKAWDEVKRFYNNTEKVRKDLHKLGDYIAFELQMTPEQKEVCLNHPDNFIDKMYYAIEDAVEAESLEGLDEIHKQYEKEPRDSIIDELNQDQLDKAREMDPHGFGKRIDERGF